LYARERAVPIDGFPIGEYLHVDRGGLRVDIKPMVQRFLRRMADAANYSWCIDNHGT
jgi:hypothetical protein